MDENTNRIISLRRGERTTFTFYTREGGLIPKRELVDGKVFVLTGTLATMTRAQAVAAIRERGGYVVEHPTKNSYFDYLVAGIRTGEKKTQAARDIGAAVISEEMFLRMLGATRGTLADPLPEPTARKDLKKPEVPKPSGELPTTRRRLDLD